MLPWSPARCQSPDPRHLSFAESKELTCMSYLCERAKACSTSSAERACSRCARCHISPPCREVVPEPGTRFLED